MIRMTANLVTVIGIAAGISNMVATVPEILANFEDPARAGSQSPWRNYLQLQGNFLWLIYGIQKRDSVMKLFASLGVALAAIALVQTLLAL